MLVFDYDQNLYLPHFGGHKPGDSYYFHLCLLTYLELMIIEHKIWMYKHIMKVKVLNETESSGLEKVWVYLNVRIRK